VEAPADQAIACGFRLSPIAEHHLPTGLVGYLREGGVRPRFLAGLAFDFCVRYSAEDAHREGFAVVVIEDDCWGIDVDGLRWQLRAKARID